MYYPIQIPFILNQDFTQNMKYAETSASKCGGFGICFWEMQSLNDIELSVKNVIVADGCIDIVVAFDERQIGFSGKSKTDFNYEIVTPARFMGIRLMPGAFHQLTGLPASAAMDTFLPIETVFDDFDCDQFFSLPFELAKAHFAEYVSSKTRDKTPDIFTTLFHSLSENAPAATSDLYKSLHFSPRQCQRLFSKHYGITPKMVLSIVRFQRCLRMLISPRSKTADVSNTTGYYDQPHFIKDFKRNIGITPSELIRIYGN